MNEAVRRHFEVICCLCAQATEKYLKGYLAFHDLVPKKTHDLVFLNDCSVAINADFNLIYTECRFLSRFATDIRYPTKYVVTENHVKFAITSVEKIRNFKPISDMREVVNNEMPELF